MNSENYLFSIDHPYTSGICGGLLTRLRFFGCLPLSIENRYDVYIVDNCIHSFRQDDILAFLKNDNSYKIYVKDFGNSRYGNSGYGKMPVLSVLIYETQINISYTNSYDFSLTGEKMTTFLRNIENCYTKFHELNIKIETS